MIKNVPVYDYQGSIQSEAWASNIFYTTNYRHINYIHYLLIKFAYVLQTTVNKN